MQHSEFPSDETLAAFIDGRVDEETRRRVIEHIAECPDCYSVFLGANEMRTEVAPSVVAFPRRRAFGIAAVAAAAAAAVVAVVLAPMIREWRHPGLTTLAKAAPPQRNIDGRLTGFPYQPRLQVMRGAGDESQNLKLLSVAARIQEQAKQNPTPANLHALGVAQLLIGKKDEAVKTLEAALVTETADRDVFRAIQKSTNAALLNDLSAAYAARQSSPPWLFEIADRAWQLSHSVESGWNRAVALKELKLPTRERAAWLDYLKIDSTSAWAQEARDRLKQIEDKASATLEDSNCRELWKTTVDDLLTGWPPSQELRTRLAATGKRLRQHCGDSLVEEVLNEHEAPRMLASSAALKAAALKQQDAGGIAARDAFDRADRVARGSPLIVVVDLRRAIAAFQEQRFEESTQRSREMLSTPAIRRFKVAEGQASWMLGLSLVALGDPVSARNAYSRALTTFIGLHDYASEARLSSLLAAAEETIGRLDEAWSLRLRAIEALSHASSNDYSLFIFASAAANEGMLATARQLLDEYLADPQMLSPRDRADAYCLRALVRSRAASKLDGEDLASARRLATTLPDKADRERLQGYIALVQGMSTRNIPDIDAALHYYETGKNPFVISRLLCWRGIAEARRNELQAAQIDLTNSVAVIEKQGPSFEAIEERLPFVGTTTDLFDALIDVQVRRHLYDEAFQFRERSNTLFLTGGETRRFSLQAVAGSTPPRALRVEYAVLPQQLVTWVIGHNLVRTYSTAINSNALEDVVRRAYVTRDDSPHTAALEQLSSLLLGHVPITPQTQTVTFVPDKILASVPFASLLFHESYLIEHCSVATRQSIATLSYRPDRKNLNSLLAFGNPTIPASFVSDLPPLPAAEQEVRRVASGFRTSNVFTGDRATVENFRRLSPQADIVHFAGHAVQDVKNPLNSALVFATPAGDSLTLLPARELSRLQLSRTSLVVLSACATGGGSTAGFSNVAHACLLAGVPDVIASRDAVPDTTATKFFEAFYSHLQKGTDVGTALRDAQRSFLRSSDPELRRPSAWDTFVNFTTSR